ncbi:Trypsin [Planctomycetes bacterium Poly30]|uniref:Serine protease n=1 Tax=Saltatorellus ferox TaxID=2528018 RepID=A0A518ETU6_9BACT|nr:Trypsin [Planctomycetes bacterium Poly30]
MNHSPKSHPLARGFVHVGAAALLAASAAAAPLPQVEAPAFSQVPYVVDTGWVAPTGSAATKLTLTETIQIQQPGADWMRIYFDDAVLAGDPLAGTGAELRLMALKDGGYQVMNAIELERWDNSTAYFNGDAVIIEVWARPGTGSSRVQVKSIDMGIAPAGDRSICGSLDDRVASTDPRSGRLLPIGCTGWLIQDCAGCALTAGHCTGNINVLQFNVPPSLSNGSIQNPPPSDQYPIDPSSIQSNGGQGVGNDYAYFGTFANGTTGLTVTAAQGPGFQLVSPPSVGAAQIRITGFGTDNTPNTSNQTQQTHVGPLVTSSSTTVQYATDTTGGNSGSPVIWEQMDMAVGIHTHGGCTSGGGQNSGTSFDHPGLQAFLASPQGICGAGIALQNPPTLVARGVSEQVVFQSAGAIVAGSATLHYRASAADLFQSVAMADLGSGLFAANLPAFDCGDSPEFYVSAQSTQCGQVFDPAGGATAPLDLAIGAAAVSFADDFQLDLGWTTGVAGATTGQWERGVPVNDPSWAYDPSGDGDGSGSCYLTQNAAGNTDIDGGAVILISPSVTVAAADTQLSFLRYQSLTDEGGDDVLLVEVSADGGSTFAAVASYQTSTNGWSEETISATQLAAAGVGIGSNLVVRFTANDGGAATIHEAGIDGFAVQAITCDPLAIGAIYCAPAQINSTGSAATLRGQGSEVLVDNDVTLIAESLPSQALGYFLVSPNAGNVPNAGGSSGTLCLGMPLGRYAGNVLNSGATGTYQMPVNLNSIPQPLGSVAGMVGQTWRFQAWYRDSFLGISTSNFTSGLALTLR